MRGPASRDPEGDSEDLESGPISQAGGQLRIARSRGSGGCARMRIPGRERPKGGGGGPEGPLRGEGQRDIGQPRQHSEHPLSDPTRPDG